MADGVFDVDDFLKQVNDPRFIPGIYNYCNRWCERCRFADRCSLNAEKRRESGKAHKTPAQGAQTWPKRCGHSSIRNSSSPFKLWI